MPTDPKKYQESLLPWSRWKHAILIEYLKAMSAIMRSWKSIYYVDGFAGPGLYTKDNAIGSPVLAARHAQELARTNAEYALQCINVELDDCVFQNLEGSTKQYSDYVTNRHGDFGQFVSEILCMIGDKPTLFFLDPIGLKGLEWQALLPIFHRDAKTEFLIRFDAQTATRLTGSDTSLHATFNAILGEHDSEYWTRYVNDFTIRPFDKKSLLTRAYEDKLGGFFDFVTRIPIRSFENQVEYFLIYATRNLTGIRAMNDALNKIEDLRARTMEEERQARNTVGQIDMFTAAMLDFLETDLSDLKRILEQVMSDGNPINRGDLRARVSMEGDSFGRFSGSHFTAVLGGRARGINVPAEFENLKSRIQIHNGLTLGSDKVVISLTR